MTRCACSPAFISSRHARRRSCHILAGVVYDYTGSSEEEKLLRQTLDRVNRNASDDGEKPPSMAGNTSTHELADSSSRAPHLSLAIERLDPEDSFQSAKKENARSIPKAALTGALLLVVLYLVALSLGVAMTVWFRGCDPTLLGRISSIDQVIEHQGDRTKELCLKRRSLWLARINRADLNTKRTGIRVCGAHFVKDRHSCEKRWTATGPRRCYSATARNREIPNATLAQKDDGTRPVQLTPSVKPRQWKQQGRRIRTQLPFLRRRRRQRKKESG
ncbi:hypothetical protein HPB51_028216 [Rhipicephalus microplus]|uniref:Uncharacterized protein n=1 Tax=Rhipicephalus microplus TaxID=6941 RepID=A0A9J6CY39_RHIMP|nr:hypothetical protein HPB51_028216 [Rhipicephalus microplus]